jgi:Tol biopolymer transport system component
MIRLFALVGAAAAITCLAGSETSGAGCCTVSRDDYVPVWSPDGESIAFTRFLGGSQFVQLVAPAGGVARGVAEGRDPAWSPDGTELAFTGPDGIRVLTLATGRSRQVTGDRTDFAAAFSPDGGSIAFRRGAGDVWVVSSHAVGPRRIATAFRSRHLTGSAQRLSWSADGTRIALASRRDARATSDDEILIAHADGSGQHTLASSPAQDLEPIWSPTGERIAFSSTRTGNPEVYVANADGSGLVNVSRHRAYDAEPAWARDGSRIAFASSRDSPTAGKLFVVGADGSGLRKIGGATSANHPDWSPDGGRLTFMGRNLCPGLGIYVMQASGGGAARLTLDCTITGSEAADRLIGTGGRDIVFGRGGNDAILLAEGSDFGFGEEGADELRGGIEPDRLDGGAGPDVLRGEGSRDVLKGGSGRDLLYGGAGRDAVLARDGERDQISCGSERDRVVADRLDRVARDCETVSRR